MSACRRSICSSAGDEAAAPGVSPAAPMRKPRTVTSSCQGTISTEVFVTGRPRAWLSRGGPWDSSSAGSPQPTAAASRPSAATVQPKRLNHRLVFGLAALASGMG